MYYSGPCAGDNQKGPSSREDLLSCCWIAQFPPDGKLDGKSMKSKAGHI